MEHNVCDILAQRMKHNKTSWTISGADHIAKILAEKASGSLYTTINSVLYGVIPDEKFEEIVESRHSHSGPSKQAAQEKQRISSP